MRELLHVQLLLVAGCQYPLEVALGYYPYTAGREGPVSDGDLAQSESYWGLRDGMPMVPDGRVE